MHLNHKDCELYYCSQVGGGDNYFRGATYQRGYGFFGDLRRSISPLAMKAGKYLGAHLLRTGRNILSDVGRGSSFKDSAQTQLRETSKQIKEDIFKRLQQGRGIKRKTKTKPNHSKSKRKRKTKSTDIFS